MLLGGIDSEGDISFEVDLFNPETQQLDMEAIRLMALKHKPKLIICGFISGFIGSQINFINGNNIFIQISILFFGISINLIIFSILSNLSGIKEVKDMLLIIKKKLTLF